MSRRAPRPASRRARASNPASRERRARPRRRGEPVARADRSARASVEEAPLVAVGDREQGERRLARRRAAAGTSDAPVSALAIATRGSSAIPMTSPVDCMNGPTDGSTPLSFAVENAGRLDGDERRLAAQAALPAELAQRRPERDPHGELDHRHAGHLGQERHGPAGAAG